MNATLPSRLRAAIASFILCPVLAGAGPYVPAGSDGFATSTHTGSVWDWAHTWSASRFAILIAIVCVTWLLVFGLFFPAQLAPNRASPPWPRTAFGRSLALVWLCSGLSFLVLFGLLGDELARPGWTIFPHELSFLNKHWPWLAVLFITLVGGWFFAWVVRHPHDAATVK